MAAELCRRGFLAATFSDAVPDYDMVALDSEGRAATVQVKTILGGDWQLSNASQLVDIELGEDLVQRVVGPKAAQAPCDIWVFVSLTGDSPDYYVATLAEVQELVCLRYAAYLDKHGGIKPRNPRSFHHAIRIGDLTDWKNRWDLVQDVVARRSGAPA
ncbi:MAG: hypothetical protein WD557_02175 [Dehalococcoidia bacterium]